MALFVAGYMLLHGMAIIVFATVMPLLYHLFI